MKAQIFLAALLIAGTAAAQQQPAPAPAPTPAPAPAQTTTPALKQDSTAQTTNVPPPAPLNISILSFTNRSDEITHGRLTFSGPAVIVAKSHNPLQLFNPWATPEPRPGESRLSYDSQGRENGVKILGIRF